MEAGLVRQEPDRQALVLLELGLGAEERLEACVGRLEHAPRFLGLGLRALVVEPVVLGLDDVRRRVGRDGRCREQEQENERRAAHAST